MDRFKVAAVQFETKPGDKMANLLKAEKMLDDAALENVKLAVFPEYAWTGYPAAEFAEPIPSGIISKHLSRKAKEHDMYIITGSIIEELNGKLYLTNALINSDGEILGKQSKISILGGPEWSARAKSEHEWPHMKDDIGAGIVPGETLQPYKTELGSIGMLFTADVDVPEHAGTLTYKGAEILVISYRLEMGAFAEETEFLSRTRSWENTCYTVLADAVGRWINSPEGDLTYHGHSLIISPCGEIISVGSRRYEGLITGVIDLKWLRELREYMYIPSLREPNPKVYDLGYFDVREKVQKGFSKSNVHVPREK